MTRSKPYLFFFFLSLAFLLSAQNKKAVKLTEKSDEAVKERRFGEAISLLKKAIEKDRSYGTAYLKLAGIYNIYRRQDSALLYYNEYVTNVPTNQIKENIWMRIAKLSYELGQYQNAKEAILHTSTQEGLLWESIHFSVNSVEKDVKINIEPLPDAINQFGMQYFPALTVDERTIIYTKMNPNARVPQEDIVISSKINGEWIPAQSLSKDVNTPFNEGAASISADGNTLIFAACEGRPSFGSCDLYITYRQGNEWAEPINLGSKVNTQFWESQPALSSDGRTLYFASNRSGGKGKRDLYVTHYDGLYWSKPQNLGDSINTPGDETTPFIHANNTLLFFSSDGHPGLGKLDLFLSEKRKGGWGRPVNLGYPINTVNDELSLFVNSQGTTAYYAKEEEQRRKSTIVKFQLPTDSLVRNKASYITGKVSDATNGNPIGANFRMVNLNDTSDVYRVRSDSITGKYFLVLTSGKEYGVFISRQGYMFEDLKFKARENSVLAPDTVDIELQPIKAGQTITLENIYFDFDDYTLDQKSIAELEDIARFIISNKDLTFKIAGHTDNKGSESYNLELSRKRAKSVHDFLINEGVNPKNLKYEGLGSSEPAFSNDTEEGRSGNRRITFSVIEDN